MTSATNIVGVTALNATDNPGPGVAVALGNRLTFITEQTGINVCIPTLDSELLGFISLQRTLQDIGVATFLPTYGQFGMRSKERLFSLGLALLRSEDPAGAEVEFSLSPDLKTSDSITKF